MSLINYIPNFHMVDIWKTLLDKFTNDLEDAKSSSLIEKLDVDINLIDDLKQVMENFKNQFLSETEQKARKHMRNQVSPLP